MSKRLIIFLSLTIVIVTYLGFYHSLSIHKLSGFYEETLSKIKTKDENRVKKMQELCEEHKARLQKDYEDYRKIEKEFSYLSVNFLSFYKDCFKIFDFSLFYTINTNILHSSGVKYPRLHQQVGLTSSFHNGRNYLSLSRFQSDDLGILINMETTVMLLKVKDI